MTPHRECADLLNAEVSEIDYIMYLNVVAQKLTRIKIRYSGVVENEVGSIKGECCMLEVGYD